MSVNAYDRLPIMPTHRTPFTDFEMLSGFLVIYKFISQINADAGRFLVIFR